MKKKIRNVKKTEMLIAYFSVLVLVIFSAVIMSFISGNDILLSPEERSTLSFEDARVLLNDLGEEGIAWYCGQKENYTDKNGNIYGKAEREALMAILGNQFALESEFCY